jgi:alpha-glucosidase
MRYVFALPFVVLACSSEPAAEEKARPPETTVTGTPETKPATSCGDEPDLPARVRRDEDARTLVVECDGPEKVVAVTPFVDGTARIRRGENAKGSLVPVEVPETLALRTGRRGTTAVVCADAMEIRVRPGVCSVHIPGMFEDERSTPQGTERPSPPEERFFGLGLHTRGKGGPRGLDLRGTVVDLYNTDAYDGAAGGFRPDAPSLYESIPFYVAVNAGTAYGVFTDDTHRLKFDLAKSDPNVVRIETMLRPVDEWIFAGPRVRDVVRRYTRVTGRMPMPPAWSIGFHQSRWDSPCDGSPADKPFCSAAQIEGVAQRLRDEGIPADGIFLDIQHMRGYRTFTFDPDRFADPKALVDALAAKGFATQIIVDPGVKIDDAWDLYTAGKQGGHFLPYAGEVWPGAAVFPDFSAPKTQAWWSTLVAQASSLGLRGMWIDMNEPSSFITGTVPDDTPTTDGTRTMAEVHNAYGWLEAKATYEGMLSARADERPFVLSRAAYAGQQKWSAVWTGDAPSDWTTLEGTLAQLLHLGLSGMTFAGSDVGGYSGRAESTADLFSRWMALGSVSPFFRAHAEQNARRQEPWAFGEPTLDATRDLIRERYSLFPYLYSTFEESTRTGAPVMRPLFFDHDADPKTLDVADEVMFGGSILVAPIVKQGAKTRDVYLPAGSSWYELRSGARHEGGRTVPIAALDRALPAFALPMFARAGAIVPRIDPPSSLGRSPAADTLYLDVFPDSKASTFTLYEDDGARSPKSARATFTLAPTATGARLEGEGAFVTPHTKIVVRVVPHDVVVELSGSLPFTADLVFDPKATPSADVAVPIRVKLPAGTPTSTAIHVATSHGAWAHVPLVRSVDGTEATGTMLAPRGGWVFYKITRGGWPTVEKSASCTEIDDRAAFGAVGALRRVDITVATWADTCP